MQVQPASPFYSQLPYNPNMVPATSPQQDYSLLDQQQQFFALERFLMMPQYPPTNSTLAKPSCPIDDQIMADIQATTTTAPSSIPSIIVNEQSFDLFQHQLYQDQSDCSTSSSASPPSSPYSYASSLVSSPVTSMLDSSSPMTSDLLWMSSNNSAMMPQQELEYSLFDTVSFPLTMTSLEYIAPSATENAFLSQPQSIAQPQALNQAISKKIKSHHRRSSSNCSGISAYESTAHRQHRASSISSVGSATSSASSTTATTTTGANARPVKSYACPTCTKPFPTRTQLKSHMAIHTDSFPFPCEHAGCDLHFKRKHDLRRHVDAKHATVKKYVCTAGCGEGFGRRDQMVRHLRRGTCSQSQGFQTE